MGCGGEACEVVLCCLSSVQQRREERGVVSLRERAYAVIYPMACMLVFFIRLYCAYYQEDVEELQGVAFIQSTRSSLLS
ncbi:hypothetical protein P171DRAFT_173227 [Karstenula rhodostoma CBS 690.94]|uniref:Uncharacterized protein n=1 Tax=Karstenula rhodostoma CBS 690.94 TaxID=1392251 RepID=A0A9P4U599_9PLEO|nr:hypothetical protein P171DRAFT_173227 [Karstenula rhodostoma CBS 690.94]